LMTGGYHIWYQTGDSTDLNGMQVFFDKQSWWYFMDICRGDDFSEIQTIMV
jgi:hypothetical protein